MNEFKIMLGGDFPFARLGELFDVLWNYNVWFEDPPWRLLRGQWTASRVRTTNRRRMLGDLLVGPECDELEVCRLEDWLRLCAACHVDKEPLVLKALDCKFNDDDFGSVVQRLRLDFRLDLPEDPENQCEALIIRPGLKHARTLNASPYSRCIYYTSEEVWNMLDDPESARSQLRQDCADVKPLRLT